MQFSYFPNAVLKAILILIFIACVLFGTYKQLEGTFLALSCGRKWHYFALVFFLNQNSNISQQISTNHEEWSKIIHEQAVISGGLDRQCLWELCVTISECFYTEVTGSICQRQFGK